MAKTVSFDDYAKGTPRLKEHRVDEDNLADGVAYMAGFQNAVYEMIENAAQQTLDDIPSSEIAGYDFDLDKESADQLYDCTDEYSIPEYISYVGRPKSFAVQNRSVYYLFLIKQDRDEDLLWDWDDDEDDEEDEEEYDDDEDEDDTQITFSSLVVKVTPEKQVFYLTREEPVEWIRQESTESVLKALEKNTAEADIIRLFAEQMGCPPLVIPGELAQDATRDNRGLIKLSDKLDGLAKFELVLDESEEAVNTALVPADIDRCGAAVMQEGRDYVLYQYLDLSDLFDAEDMDDDTDDDLFYMDDEDSDYLILEPVFTTRDINRMIEVLTELWDRYAREQTTYTFPLSEERYMESRRPFHGFKIWGKYHESVRVSDLTPTEKKNYNRVLKVFNKRKPTKGL